MKTLRVNKNVKEIEDEGVWGNLEPKKVPETLTQKYMRLTLVFLSNSTQPEKFTFYFLTVFI